MKTLITILLVALSTITYSQRTDQIRFTTGISAGAYGEVYSRTALTSTERGAIFQVAYCTSFKDDYIQLKIGYGYDSKKWRAYLYLPYFNYNMDKGYNTPFSAEVFYDNSFSLNIDVYKNVVVPSLRWTVEIYKNEPIPYKR